MTSAELQGNLGCFRVQAFRAGRRYTVGDYPDLDAARGAALLFWRVYGNYDRVQVEERIGDEELRGATHVVYGRIAA